WVEAVADRRDEVEVVGIQEAAARRGRNAKREGLCGLPGGETVIERLAQHPDLVAGGALDPVRDPRMQATTGGDREARFGCLTDEVVRHAHRPGRLDSQAPR